MRDSIALTVFSSALLLPVAIYIAGKLSRRASQFAYRLLGVLCLLIAAGFFSFVGWYFLTTGQLVFPGKYGIPAKIISPADSPSHRAFVGTFNFLAGSILAFIGATMLRLKKMPNSGHSDEA